MATHPNLTLSLMSRDDVLILDGATSTELERRGVPVDRAAWTATALLTHPDQVRELHCDYIRAGADLITTNTFFTARHVLQAAGLANQFQDLNTQAVRLAREAREQSTTRTVAIAGAITTVNLMRTPPLTSSPAQARTNYRDQAETLAEAGADLILLEMMRDVEHTVYAVEAAASTGLPVWIGFSCRIDHNGEVTLWNRRDLLATALQTLTPKANTLMSVMHTQVEDVAPALNIMQDHWAGPVGVYPHSGTFANGQWRFTDVITPEQLLDQARQWIAQGVRLIGGCCGISPKHISHLRDNLPTRAI